MVFFSRSSAEKFLSLSSRPVDSCRFVTGKWELLGGSEELVAAGVINGVV